jgi:hypothetical protein
VTNRFLLLLLTLVHQTEPIAWHWCQTAAAAVTAARLLLLLSRLLLLLLHSC